MNVSSNDNDGNLSSVLIVLRPLRAGQLNNYAGYLAHAAFLDLLQQVDPALSQVLHDLKQRKPFTLSSLLEEGDPTNDNQTFFATRNSAISLNPNRLYGLRLTTLASTVLNTFTARFFKLDASSLQVRLGNYAFQVVRVEGSRSGDNQWVAHSSFSQLLQVPPACSWTFQFASPTAFSLGEQAGGGRKFVVLPDPHHLFDSLAGAWNAFAPESSQSVDVYALKEYVEKYLVVSGYNCQTAMLEFKHNRQLGFVGEVSYRVMEKQPSLEMAVLLNRLAGLAIYAGVGYKTTMGMGQARCSRVEELSVAAAGRTGPTTLKNRKAVDL